MSNFNNASLIVTPNGYKAGKLYSIKPTSGAGNLDVVRATSATRVNASGLIESVGNNIPRLDYTNASCPSILVEPQRTNLVFPSATATTQTRAVSAVAHTLSFYGTGSVTLSGVATGTLNGTGANNRVRLTFTPTAGNLTLTVSGSVTDWQLEVGANATSYIPTVASTVTRNADVISKTGVSSLIGQTEGTIYWDIAFVNGVATGTGNPQFGIRNTAFTNWIGLTSNNLVNPFRITARATTGFIIDYEVNITSGKAAVAWSSAGVVLYVNGVQVRTSATNPNFSFDRIDMIALMTFNVKGFALLPTRLSNTELAQLTTL